MSRQSYSQLLWRQRVTRRSILRSAGVAIGAAMVGGNLIGCEGSSDQKAKPAAVATTDEPKRGGTVVFAYSRQQTDTHPHTGVSEVNRLVYDRLYLYDYVNGKWALSLAQALEMPDPLTYVFKIKPNARHQDIPPVNGRKVTSEDVVTSWDAYRDNPRTFNKILFTDYVDRYEIPDSSMLVVKLKQPNAWLVGSDGFGAPYASVVIPRELFEKNLLDKVAIGPGAFVLEKFDPAGTISFLRRPDAWHTSERPYIDRWVYHIITDDAARVAALKAKQIDTLGARDKLQAEEFKSFGSDMQIIRDISSYPWMLYMRSDPEGGLFHDVRVRQAVYYALDIKEFIERVDLGEGELCGPVPAHLEAWVLPADEIKKIFPYDLKTAKQLLAAGNWDSSLEVEFKYPNYEKTSLYASVMQKQMAALGIKLKLVPQDPRTVWDSQTIRKRDFQMMGGQIAGYLGVDVWLRIRSTEGSGVGNLARWSDPEVDETVRRQQTEFNFEKQRQIILDAQRLMLKKFAPNVNLYTPYSLTGRWSYYHPSAATMGFVGSYGHYAWMDKDAAPPR